MMRHAVRTGLVAVWLCTLALSAEVAGQEARPEVAPVAQVYTSGASTLTVTMVRIGEREANKYLIQFSGVDSEWNGRIIRHICKIGVRASDCYNEAMRPGEKYYAFVGRSGWFASQYFDVYLPDLAVKPVYVYYDKGASEAVNPEHFLTAYMEQEDA